MLNIKETKEQRGGLTSPLSAQRHALGCLCVRVDANKIMPFSTIASKINVTPKGVYLPISKLRSILAVANLLAHNNISEICYCGQISLQSTKVFLTTMGVTFILLAVVLAKS